MFMQAYQDAMEDEQDSMRRSEGEIMERAVHMMRQSDQNPSDRMFRTRAIYFISQIWSYFLNDLSSAENATPSALKANLISIGIFIMKHLEIMRQEPGVKFDPLIEISQSIREGLK